MCFDVISKTNVIKLSPCFLLEVLEFQGYVEVFNRYWVYFCVLYKIGVQCILLHVDFQFSQNHLLKTLSFPIVFLAPLSKINWQFMFGFIFKIHTLKSSTLT